jgi:hypothetical protein
VSLVLSVTVIVQRPSESGEENGMVIFDFDVKFNSLSDVAVIT